MPDTLQALSRLTSLQKDIDAHMQAYFAALPTGLSIDVSTNGELALERLKDFSTRPGKRIRGALAIIAYDMFGGTKQQVALDLAVAIELIQNYLLIVDDVMDHSDGRRGGPTVHRYYQAVLKHDFPQHDSEHLGNMLGINVGLIAQHLAARLLNEVDEAPTRIQKAEHIFQTNIAATGFGQIDDLMNEAGQKVSLDETRHMYMLKSSYYTFVNPLQTGAALAGADYAQLLPLKQFGLHAGVAFQLQDDLIGMFGDERKTGKSTLDDLREGKLTFLMQHALQHASPSQRKVIDAALGNPKVTAAQHRAVQAILESLGSRQYVQVASRTEIAAALAVLDSQKEWQAEAVAFLRELLVYIVNRKR